MSRKFSAALLLGRAVITFAAEPRSPGSTLPGTIDTAGYSVFRYDDTLGKYKTAAQPEVPAASQQQPNTQTGQQVNGPQEAREPGATSTPRSSTNAIGLSSQSRTLIQEELKSASTIAKTGATLYGMGFVVEVIGVIVLVNDLTGTDNWNSSEPPLTGLYVALGGRSNIVYRINRGKFRRVKSKKYA